MGEPPPIERPALERPRAGLGESEPVLQPPQAAREEPAQGLRSRSPTTAWPPWTAPVALVAGVALAFVGAVVVELPATLLFGANTSSSHLSPGVSIADTFVQDVGFVLAAVYFAHFGGRVVRSWQFGLRRPGAGWWRAGGLIFTLLLAFVVLTVLWSLAVHPGEEKTLEQLGTNEGSALLVLSAGLTCVVAPICEEFLFRGFMFTALRNWRGTLPAAVITGLVFGGIHAESAPVLDLVPLAALGFGLCLLYRYTGSLYPCMITHSLNNSLAFSNLEGWGWGWQAPVLMVSALVGVGAVVLACKRLGLIASDTPFAHAGA